MSINVNVLKYYCRTEGGVTVFYCIYHPWMIRSRFYQNGVCRWGRWCGFIVLTLTKQIYSDPDCPAMSNDHIFVEDFSQTAHSVQCSIVTLIMQTMQTYVS